MYWNWARKAGLFAAIVLFALVVSFSLALVNTLETDAVRPLEFKDLGQGIYKLEVILSSDNDSEILKKSLVKFRQDHPNLRITAAGPVKQDGYGVIKEFIIITEPK